MQHVMVPVPEQHLAEFRSGLMRLTLGMAGWDETSVGAFVAGLEAAGEPTRLLVKMVAEAAADHDRVPYTDAAKALDVELGDVLLLVTEINDRCRRAEVPLLLITDTSSTVRADGTPSAVPVLAIVAPVAKKLLDLWPPTNRSVTNP